MESSEDLSSNTSDESSNDELSETRSGFSPGVPDNTSAGRINYLHMLKSVSSDRGRRDKSKRTRDRSTTREPVSKRLKPNEDSQIVSSQAETFATSHLKERDDELDMYIEGWTGLCDALLENLGYSKRIDASAIRSSKAVRQALHRIVATHSKMLKVDKNPLLMLGLCTLGALQEPVVNLPSNMPIETGHIIIQQPNINNNQEPAIPKEPVFL